MIMHHLVNGKKKPGARKLSVMVSVVDPGPNGTVIFDRKLLTLSGCTVKMARGLANRAFKVSRQDLINFMRSNPE